MKLNFNYLIILSLFHYILSIKVNSISSIIIGTRGSPLALAQAELTKELLQKNFPELNQNKNQIIIKKIMTQVI